MLSWELILLNFQILFHKVVIFAACWNRVSELAVTASNLSFYHFHSMKKERVIPISWLDYSVIIME